MDIAEILYSIYTVAFQMLLMDLIFGMPKVTKEIVSHILYGILWTAGLYIAGNCETIIYTFGRFIPYITVFLLFEIIFVFLVCRYKGSALCRFATFMAGWTTFILSKTLITYIGVEDYAIYFWSILIELIMGFYIYVLRFNDARELSVRDSGYLLVTCIMMFFVTVSEVALVLQDFKGFMSLGSLGWKIISLFVMTELVIYTMISYLSKEYSRKMYKTFIEEKKSHSNELKDLNKLNHELKNKVFYMKELLDAKNYDKLQLYFQENFDLTIISEEEYTGNKVIDDCIKIKKEKAHQNDIDFIIEASTLPQDVIDEGDLTELIFNLLDNAIEAVSDLQADKWVKLKLKYKKGYIYIDVSNSAKGDVLAANPRLMTSKMDAERHGFGMEIIGEIVESYNGMIKHESNEGYFATNIMLML